MDAFKGPGGLVSTSKSYQQLESAVPIASAPEAAPSIDLDHLRRYTFGDERLEREVLELFFANAPGMVTEIRAARDEASWRRAAHSLKGSALAVGAWGVARRAEQAEAAAARHGEAGDVLAGLDDAVEQARRFIAARHLHV